MAATAFPIFFLSSSSFTLANNNNNNLFFSKNKFKLYFIFFRVFDYTSWIPSFATSSSSSSSSSTPTVAFSSASTLASAFTSTSTSPAFSYSFDFSTRVAGGRKTNTLPTSPLASSATAASSNASLLPKTKGQLYLRICLAAGRHHLSSMRKLHVVERRGLDTVTFDCARFKDTSVGTAAAIESTRKGSSDGGAWSIPSTPRANPTCANEKESDAQTINQEQQLTANFFGDGGLSSSTTSMIEHRRREVSNQSKKKRRLILQSFRVTVR